MPVINVGDWLWWRRSRQGPWLVERMAAFKKVRIWCPDYGTQFAYPEELYTPAVVALRRRTARNTGGVSDQSTIPATAGRHMSRASSQQRTASNGGGVM